MAAVGKSVATKNYKQITNMTDEELLQLSSRNNYDAFEELVRRYEARIYRLGLKILHSPQDAEDLLQKTFLSVFENMHKFRGDAKVSTWIFRIATNHALMKLRKEKGKTVDSIDAPVKFEQENVLPQFIDKESDVSGTYERRELIRHLEQGIMELPDIYRLVFILRDVEGFSNKDVAQMLNLSVPAVKSRILRARLFLKDKLSQLENKEEA